MSRSLTVQVAVGGKGFSVSLSPSILFLFLVLGFGSYQWAGHQTLSQSRQQAEELTELRRQNQELSKSLSESEQERQRLASLAESRSEELWGELKSRDRQIERLWRVVGQRPEEMQRRRYSLVASRGSARSSPQPRVEAEYHELLNKFHESEEQLEDLTQAAAEYRRKKVAAYKAHLASVTPSINPCTGDMTSGFGNRVHPVYGVGRFHGGCDFTAPHGTEIRATAAGTVASSDWLGGYGKTVEIDHGRGLKTLYAHCSELMVKKGDQVEKGQVIARVGTTGLSSGPHCHYEVHKNNKPIDPTPYLALPRGVAQKEPSKPVAKL